LSLLRPQRRDRRDPAGSARTPSCATSRGSSPRPASGRARPWSRRRSRVSARR